jgi:predicted RNA-binding protein with PUA domain
MIAPSAARTTAVDAVDRAFDEAPLDVRPATPEEIEALRAARAEVAGGAELISHDEVMRRAREVLGAK